MGYLSEFENALTIEVYEHELGEQLALHQLHYRKAVDKKPEFQFPALKILVITVPPCGDSLAIIPVLQKYFRESKVDIRIALRDENPELMNRFLTKGKKSVPVILVLDKEGNLLFRYGPRPAKAQEIYDKLRPLWEVGKIEKTEIQRRIRFFYAKDRGKSILEEFESILLRTLQYKQIGLQ